MMTLRFACKLALCLFLLTGYGTSVLAAQLLMVEQDGCHYCAKFHREIGPAYPNTAEGKQAPLRVVNMDEPWPSDLDNIKRPFVSPTFILIHEEQEVDRLIGYPGDDYFWFLLGEMLAKLPS